MHVIPAISYPIALCLDKDPLYIDNYLSTRSDLKFDFTGFAAIY
jgi:hypothetical protein